MFVVCTLRLNIHIKGDEAILAVKEVSQSAPRLNKSFNK
ncbi:hypothetical protein VCHENC01_3466 [Vibrio harveyi]|nr:hypothetical protein VCHENC01_3466 [Vibrio harveyi]